MICEDEVHYWMERHNWYLRKYCYLLKFNLLNVVILLRQSQVKMYKFYYYYNFFVMKIKTVYYDINKLKRKNVYHGRPIIVFALYFILVIHIYLF